MRLGELLDLDMLRRLAEANYQASGMPIGIIDAVDSSTLIGFGWQDICAMFHRAHLLTAERCRESDNYIKDHLSEGKPVEYICKNGLRDIGVPIKAGGQHLATLFLGQFFYEGESPHRGFFEKQAQEFGFDATGYMAALDRVPIFTRASVENILKYNISLASFISELADASLQRREAEQRAESLARFPEENPDPVVRLRADSKVLYANDAARRMLADLGREAGRSAYDQLTEIARHALRVNHPVHAEVMAGDRVFAVTAMAAGSEVNAYAHDVTSRKLMEGKLRETNKAKDEFFAVLSHEIRNPLAPIRNSLYILAKVPEPGGVLGERVHRAKEVAGRQLAQLTHLIDDLLDVTRIERGKVLLRRTDLDFSKLVRRTAEDHRGLMETRGLDFSIEVPDVPMSVDGDETRLAQAIGNLLQNAAKFTPEGGSVKVTLGSDEGSVEVHVHDTGCGIEPELLSHIWDPFVQAKQSLARTEGGLGLGLALVKHLVELHGGTVAARSEGRDRGAEFVIRLPVLAAKEAGLWDGEHRSGAGSMPRLRVLVVDDIKDAAESLADVVRMLGHDAEVAYDGASAIESVRANPPDLVLCDIGLPGLNGYQVARALRADHRFDQVQLVAVSGYAQPEDRARALGAGFVDHIAKPPELSMLKQILNSRVTRQ